MRNHTKSLLRITHKVFLCTLLILSSCQSNIQYHSYQPVSQTGWQKNDTLFFTPSTLTESGTYKMEIGIRHLESYKYRDLWIEISNNLQDSTQFQKDTVHIYLADSVGNWLGKGIGGLVQYATDYKTYNMSRTNAHTPTFQITHLMNDSLLENINNMGLKISKLP